MKFQKRFYWVPLCFLLIAGFVGYGLFTHLVFKIHAFGGGVGSEGDPYQITSCSDFQAINGNLGAYYIIENNFSCSSVSDWSSLGTFTGVLDGNGKTISDFTGTNANGIFAGLSGATVKDLTINNVNMTWGADSVGTLAATSGGITITDVHVTSGSVVGGGNQVGGLIGNIESGALTDVSSNATVSGVSFVGGLVGRSLGTIDGGSATGNVSSTGVVVGGLVGYSTGAISNSFATGNVYENTPGASDQWATGGLVGYSGGGITNSYATGNVNSYWEPGGLVGWAQDTPISNCYATGNVGNIITTATRAGGFVGVQMTDISNSFATGNVTGGSEVGGFTGGIWNGTLSYSYSKGLVTGTASVGGLVGSFNGGAVDGSSYYDSQTSGQSDTGKGTPETTSAMKTQSTYVGWDFSTIWNIDSSTNDGYPFNYTPSAPSNVATVVSSTYTVSAGGTSNETITNVTFGTAKAAFLANLQKGNSNQTWNTSSVADPVVSGNTLVVTSQDETTSVTYTITVNAELNHVATISSTVYTVSAGGTANETISEVAALTSQEDFLANITKDDSNETFNTDNLSDPVVYNDTLVVTAQDGTTQVTYTLIAPPYTGTGDGTSESPYEITSCSQLQEMSYYLSSNFELAQNIDCSETSTWNGGEGFIPVGSSPSTPFVGVLNGNSHTITGLTINKSDQGGGAFVGIFGAIDDGALVENLNITDINIRAIHYSFVGSLAGGFGMANSSGSATIDNVNVLSGDINGSTQTGGLIGQTADGNGYVIKSSSVNMNVTGSGYVGGLVGQNGAVIITKSHTSGSVTGTGNDIGGLVGTNYGGTINNCYSTATVSGNNEVGGLAGVHYDGSINGSITNSYATGSVTAVNDAGGLVGQSTSSITMSYATGSVLGTGTGAGGLVGTNHGTTSDTYATGNVSGVSSVGGLMGANTSGNVLTNSYSVGVVTATGSDVGGLVGQFGGPTPVSSYYNSDTSGQSDTGKGEAKTTAEMKDKATYDGWGFDTTWRIYSDINNGYPSLGYFKGGDGSQANPYQIQDCRDLQAIENDLSADYILANNIDCSDTSTWNSNLGFTPISDFTGTLDGNWNTISNLKIDVQTQTSGSNIGIFAILDNATVKNLFISHPQVFFSNHTNVGILAGEVGNGTYGFSTISNVHVSKGTLSGSKGNNIGGLVGAIQYIGQSSVVSNSSADVDISIYGTSGSSVGGFAGSSTGANITDSVATGDVDDYASGSNFIGGFIGSFSSGDVERCYATGSVTGDNYLGGFVGSATPGPVAPVIKNSYATGDVTETDAGSRDGGNIGGFVGQSIVEIDNSYSTGVIDSGNTSNFTGGFAGAMHGGSINNCFWNTETSGLPTSNGGTGETTAQMQDQATYTGWDFDTLWRINSSINNGYPTNHSNIATITSSTYTVSTFGEGKEIITNVTEGTSKSSFLASFAKSNPEETWITTKLSDPIADGDSLTVLAGDGLTQIVYMIPYHISTCQELENINNNLNSSYILDNNINCQDFNWVPIGTDPSNSFTGVLEGNNKTVSNVSYTNAGNSFFVGMFAAMDGGVIANLTLSNLVISGIGTVGGLVAGVGMGETAIGSIIDNVHISSGSVTGSNWVGGLVGGLYWNDTIKNSSVDANVNGHTGMTGGLVGFSYGTITSSHATGAVQGGDYTGGLIGIEWKNSYNNVVNQISNSYATGNVTSTGMYVGGFIGGSEVAMINCYATGDVTMIGGGQSTGGFAGAIQDQYSSPIITLSNLYATGTVLSDGSHVGGLIGDLWNSAKSIGNLYATGNVTGTSYIGGLIGYASATNSLTNAFATGIVTGTGTDGYVGGLIGLNYMSIRNSSATGAVSSLGGNNVGGLLGYSSGSIDNSYALGSVQASGNYVGGLAGVVYNNITNSYAKGNVTVTGDGVQDIGGLLGVLYNNIANSYASGDVTVSGASVEFIGGLVGEVHNSTALSGLYAKGNVTAPNGDSIGGLIGYYTGESLDKSFHEGSVSGSTYVGGLIGKALEGPISNSYAKGSVSGSTIVGGLIGDMEVPIINSYAAAPVSGTSSVGGLIGELEDDTCPTTEGGACAITSSYYDSEVSGQADNGLGVGKATSEMKTQSTYTGWDFTTPVWHIDPDTNEGYPYNYVASSDATVTSSEYTVSANGTANETISDVPSGVSTLEFLSNITKGNAFQTFNTANLSDPVVSGNTLVVTSEDGNNTVTYTVDVIHELSSIATLTSSTYTVSAGGTANETITNVPSGTSKTTLLGALTRSDANELWNTSAIANPVVSGNTLVVTSEDGNTTVTYTITVNGGTTPSDLVPSRAYYSGPDNWGVQNTKFTVSGDFNNDGKDDVAAMYDYGNGKMGIWVFQSDGTNMTPVNMYMGTDGGWNVDATRYVVAGDFNNDGKEDIAAMYDYGNGFMGIWAFQSDGTTFTPTRIYTGIQGGWNVSATKFVVSGDFNNDGKEDIAAMYDYGNNFMGIWAFQSDGTNLTPTRIYTGVTGGWNVAATKYVVSGDFNNDGKEDIAAMYDYGNNFMGIWAFQSDGTNLVPSRIYTGAPGGWNVAATKYVVSGDFNSDGKEDIAAMYDYGNGFMGIWAFESDGTNLAPTRIYTGVTGGWNVDATRFVVSGDYNGDNIDDLAAIYDYGNNNMGIWIFK